MVKNKVTTRIRPSAIGKLNKHSFFFYIIIPFCIFLALVAVIGQVYADTDSYNYTDNSFKEFKATIDSAIGQSNNIHENDTTSDNAMVSSQMLNVNGPLQFSTIFSDQYGFMLNTEYSHLLNIRNAIALEGDIGSQENRINLTFGHAFSPKNRIKFTVEGLGQNQTFNFDSGDIDQWVFQFAGGAEFQKLLSNGFLNNFSIGGYYARSLSRTLDAVLYQDSSNEFWVNYRHIAGATSTGEHISLGLRPWKTGIFTLTGYYDTVDYHIVYDDTIDANSSEVGYGIQWDQYLSKALKTSIEYSHRALYDTLQVALQFFWNIRHDKNTIGLSLAGTRNTYNTSDDVNADNSNENLISLGLQYYFTPIRNTYSLPEFDINSLSVWTATPAVRMAKVMAIADQKTVAAKLNWTSQLTYSAVDENREKLSWLTNASSNVPDASIQYKLYVQPVVESQDPDFSYEKDVTGLSDTTVSNLKSGTTYHATLQVSERRTGQTLTAEKDFITGSSEFSWNPQFSSSNVTETSLSLIWKAPARSVQEDDITYEVTLTNQDDSADTQKLKKTDSANEGEDVSLDFSELTPGCTYNVTITASDAHNDNYDITQTDYTCNTIKDTVPAGSDFTVDANASSAKFTWKSPKRYSSETVTYTLTLRNQDNSDDQHTYENITSSNDTKEDIQITYDTSSDGSYQLTPNSTYKAILSAKSTHTDYSDVPLDEFNTMQGDITWGDGSVAATQSQSNDTVTITWPQAYVSTEGDTINYKLTETHNNKTTTLADSLTDTSYTTKDLAHSQTYTFRVTAYDVKNYYKSSDKVSDAVTTYGDITWEGDITIPNPTSSKDHDSGIVTDKFKNISWKAATPSNTNDTIYYDYTIQDCNGSSSQTATCGGARKHGTTTATTIDDEYDRDYIDYDDWYYGIKVSVTARDSNDYNQGKSKTHWG
jgi:hypothetical protein